MSKLCRSVRGGRLGSVGTNRPRLCLLWEAVHPIRRHCTPSDRVHRYVTGVSLRNGCTVTDRVHRDGSGAAPLMWTACYRRGAGRLRGLRQRRHQLGSFFWGAAGPVSRCRAFRPADAACLRGSGRGCRRLTEGPLHVPPGSRRHYGAGRGMGAPEPGPGGAEFARPGAVSGARCQARGGTLGE